MAMKKPSVRFHFSSLKKKPVLLSVGGVVVLFLVVLGLTAIIKKPLDFSYAGTSCVGQWTLFPDMMRQTAPSSYDVTFQTTARIGNWPVLATQTCVSPVEAPNVGESVVAYGPFGQLFGGKQLVVKVADPPSVTMSDVFDKTISTSRPLSIGMSESDKVYSYSMTVGDKRTTCETKESNLSCPMKPLDLAPGQKYEATLQRNFDGKPSGEVGKGSFQTLAPLQVTQQGLTEGQVIYDKPESVHFTFDRALSDTHEVTLGRQDGDAQKKVDLTLSVEGAQLTVRPKELPRNAQYTLQLREVEGTDGSTLAEPVTVHFSTSGGPKVAAVSVGATGVPQTAQIVVTFDQPINESVNVAAVARVVGVPGSVRKQSPTQLAFTVQGAPLCAGFSLNVDKGIKSGSNDESSQEAWKFDGRIVCGTSAVIGYSVQGRPIIAYYFGSGASTVLYTGGIHGNERSSQQTMQAWVGYLQTNAHQVIPAGKRVVVVPNTNPDGIASGSRNNTHNVNLGRNFPTANWSASIETASGTIPQGGGTSPGSEPEAQALIRLTRQLRPRIEVSFHSQGRLVGANKFSDSVAAGNVYASLTGYGTMYYNAEAVMGYPMTGEYEDWMGEEMGIPAILIELPSHSGNYLNSQLPALRRMITI